jgi:hypothetical protein
MSVIYDVDFQYFENILQFTAIRLYFFVLQTNPVGYVTLGDHDVRVSW